MKNRKIKNQPKVSRFSISLNYQLYIAVLLFIIAVILSRGADMTNWEITVFNHVYGWPDFLRPFFVVVTQAGSIHMLGILLLIFLIKKRFDVVFSLLVTSLLAYLISGFAKDVWGRLRPHEFLQGIVNLDYEVRGPGFPSGHTALAVAMALVIGDYLPKKFRFIVPVWIVCVGVSRMYLGIHAPLDIIGGLAVGWASYVLVRQILLIKGSDKLVVRKSRNKKI